MCGAYNAQYGTNFMSVMPTNLYGPNDNYGPQNSHVLPALIRKCHEAKESGARVSFFGAQGVPVANFCIAMTSRMLVFFNARIRRSRRWRVR